MQQKKWVFYIKKDGHECEDLWPNMKMGLILTSKMRPLRPTICLRTISTIGLAPIFNQNCDHSRRNSNLELFLKQTTDFICATIRKRSSIELFDLVRNKIPLLKIQTASRVNRPNHNKGSFHAKNRPKKMKVRKQKSCLFSVKDLQYVFLFFGASPIFK